MPFGPMAALFGTVNAEGEGLPKLWSHLISEKPAETWEIYNHTVDAHPIHIHLVEFEVVNVEHEDNEMIRPYHVGPIPPDAPAQ